MNKIGKKILIVEDDKDLLAILKTKFSDAGFSVVTAENGEEGASTTENEKPDLIIADILMPKMDGLTMAKKIRQANNQVMIVFLTNTKDADNSIEAGKTDGFEYLIKSDLKINDIIEKVKAKLEIH